MRSPTEVWSESLAQAAEARDLTLTAAERRAGGVVHTPPELAWWMAREVDRVLRERCGVAAGIADGRLCIVDPAVGPGVFLRAALAVGAGVEAPARVHGAAAPHLTVPRRVIGLDIDDRAVASARTILDPCFAERRWPLSLRVVDALSLPPGDLLAGPDSVPVILGNPPWRSSGEKADPSLRGLMEDFLRDGEGRPLAERKTGVLADAYVRFFRWAAEVVRSSGRGGVVAFVTNASFLDGPVHRGMRAALRRWFDGIEITDLGGSALVKRAAGRDDNLFGVRPAAVVTVAWRRVDGAATAARGGVLWRRLAGSRTEKLARLAEGAVPHHASLSLPSADAVWRPKLAAPRDYEQWVSLADAMPFHAEGVQTNRDDAAVADDAQGLLARLRAFTSGEALAELEHARRPLPHYDPERARAAVRAALDADPDGSKGIAVRAIAWRPLETRWFSPVAPFCHRPRPQLLRAVDHGGPVLLCVRQDRGQVPWSHVAVAGHVPDNCYFSSRSSCRTRAFPAFDPAGHANFSAEAVASWEARVGEVPSADAFRRYALAVLSSEDFRRAAAGALAVDYPRLPAPPDRAAFGAAVRLGAALEAAWLGAVKAPSDVVAEAVAALESFSVGHRSVASAELRLAIAGVPAQLPWLRDLGA